MSTKFNTFILTALASSSSFGLTPAASALPPVTAISGYSFTRSGMDLNYVAIEFDAAVLPFEVQAFVSKLGGCLAVPENGTDNFNAAISLVLIDTGAPEDNAAWLGIVHTPAGDGELHWSTIEGDSVYFLAFDKGGSSNSPEAPLGVVLDAHSQQWFDVTLDDGSSNIRRAVLSFPASMLDCDADMIPDALVLALGLGEDQDGDGRLDWCAPAGDFNGDGIIGAADLSIMLANWGLGGETDLDADGTTGASDLAMLLAGWQQ